MTQISNSPKPYLFKIVSNYEPIELENPPLEWKDCSYELDRDIDDGGVFQFFNAESLTFIKEGGTRLREIMDSEGVNGYARLYIYWFNWQTLSYQQFPTIYDFDFKKAKKVKIGNFQGGLNILVKKSALLVKLENRGSIDVDITKKTTIDGSTLVDWGENVYPDLKKTIRIPPIFSYKNAKYNGVGGRISALGTYTTIDLSELISSDFEETQAVIGELIPSKANSFFFENTESKTIEITGTILIDAIIEGGTQSAQIKTKLHIYNENGTELTNEVINTLTLSDGSTTPTITLDHSFELGDSQSAALSIAFGRVSSELAEATYTSVSLNFQQSLIQTEEKFIDCYPAYEVLERVLQKILDMQFPLYSPALGRPDTPYNYAGDTYGSEAQENLIVFTSGISLRGESIFDDNNPFSFNFNDLKQTLKSQLGIGIGIELIDGQERIVAREYDDFFSDTQIIDFSDKLNDLDLESEFANSQIFLSLESGNENYDYEAINGRGEYNTQNKRVLPINSESTFNNKAVYREDTKGIADQILAGDVESDSTDTKADNDIFAIKCQRYTGEPVGGSAVVVGGPGFVLGTQLDNYATIDIDSITSSDFDEVQTVSGGSTPSKAKSLFFESEEDRVLNIRGSIDLTATTRATTGTITVQAYAYAFNSAGVKTQEVYLDAKNMEQSAPTATMSINKDITINAGDSVCLVIAMTSRADEDDDVIWSTSDWSITQAGASVIDWEAETDENITILDNSSLFQSGSLNLMFTPTRKLIRNSNRWTAAFHNNLSAKATFQVADKLQTLKTSGEGYTITENDDIQIGESFVNLSKFKAIKHTFNINLTWADILLIQNNIYGYVKVTSNVSGWILNLSKTNAKNEATITIIEKV